MAIYNADLNAYLLEEGEEVFTPANQDDTPLKVIGNALANIISGSNGDDTLDGGSGADVLSGGIGDDTYIVDNSSDKVVEQADEGYDTVIASVNYNIGPNNGIEALIAAEGSDSLVLVGNGLDNLIVGSNGHDTLNGGVGADVMIGGSGDDVYIVDNSGDKAVETADGGFDTIVTTANYALGPNAGIEVLRAAESVQTGLALTGNAFANLIIGGMGHDTLNGAGGADTMQGGAGNDRYIIDNLNDWAVESIGSGNDTAVVSVANYDVTRLKNIESVVLVGAAIGNTGGSVSVTGSSGKFTFQGGTKKETIKGTIGNDKIAGGLGNDVLMGGRGKDTFAFNTKLDKKLNVDSIRDFSVRDDSISLAHGVFKTIKKMGTLSASEFRIGTKALDGNDHILYNRATGKLYYDADGSGKGAAIHFATVGAHLSLTNKDFFLV
ncbi:calcium-binding protein [Microvirga solisilvae]|uniref:calcium-binding protein n=1 Tax=Microvirga solisilvae TaxID=2919498 RepID=UPI001FAF93C0|nr:calcium-binding protein [Microvirga solisilvae]